MGHFWLLATSMTVFLLNCICYQKKFYYISISLYQMHFLRKRKVVRSKNDAKSAKINVKIGLNKNSTLFDIIFRRKVVKYLFIKLFCSITHYLKCHFNNFEMTYSDDLHHIWEKRVLLRKLIMWNYFPKYWFFITSQRTKVPKRIKCNVFFTLCLPISNSFPSKKVERLNN